MTVLAQVPARLGSTAPRLITPPLVTGPPGPCGCGCALTAATSYGFAVIDFARDKLGMPLDPWQERAVIHGGELLPDGRPRFRTVLVLVARQAGKTHLLTVLALFWLFVERWPLTLGMSTMLEYARESWDQARVIAEDVDELAAQLPRNAVKEGNNDVRLLTSHGTRYKIAAANRRGGRSLRIDRLIIDELREHATWVAWNAATNAMNARPFGQAWCITNMGDDTSVVLNSLRQSAKDFIEWWDEESGQRGVAELLDAPDMVGDYRLGLLEWSAPEGCDVDDPDAIAAANPNVGRRQHWDDLLGPARRAKRAGGEEEAGFRAEVLCQRVPLLNPAINPGDWKDCRDVGDLDAVRGRLAGCIDLNPDGTHATLAVAAVLDDERVRVETVHEWSGPDAAAQLERDLPGWVEKLKPRVIGWFPAGPAAAVAAKVADRRKEGVRGWPPRGVRVEDIRGETTAVCMGLVKEVKARTLAHSGQDMLDDQVAGAEKLKRGDGWVFTRAGGPADAVYAVAGAAHLARTLPKPRKVSRRTHS
ncbi:terminase [Micromonospora sp. WMMD1120]|uniref:terminase n=1 Tax=Micromonospora sp. WMMD1120 TaxID=3016106 RepID=UPI0024166745|nr:terminase [Micromonospora sp. WMMD1120]MDG4809934.1 terminase [Micromonospora sp. WMMD1120]